MVQINNRFFLVLITGLIKQCELHEEKDYVYKKLLPINSITYGQQEGYMVRLSFYVIADRDAHIIFTTSDQPNYATDSAYEICKCIIESITATNMIKRIQTKKNIVYFQLSNWWLGKPTYTYPTKTSRRG